MPIILNASEDSIGNMSKLLRINDILYFHYQRTVRVLYNVTIEPHSAKQWLNMAAEFGKGLGHDREELTHLDCIESDECRGDRVQIEIAACK